MAKAVEQSSPASPSPIYLAQSKACVNAKGECIGRGVFALESFEAGTRIISVKRPLVGSLDAERLQDTCANCYTWTEGSSIGSRLYVKDGTTVQACAGCKRFRYCGKACQKEAWNRVHKHECKTMKQLAERELPKAVQATMEILIRRKHGSISDQEWHMLCALETHIDDFKRNGSFANIQLMALGTHEYSWTKDTFPIGFVEQMYARVLTNSLTLITPTYDPLGIIIDERFGKINHSCDPNAYVVMDGPEMALRALKPIQKDEEIYIAYVDVTNPFTRRQSELEARWFFTCKCTKCQKGPTMLEDKWAISPCNISDKWRECADAMMKSEDISMNPENYVGDSKDERRVAAIQGQAFETHEVAQGIHDPAEAIKVIDQGMHTCHQPGLWPLYRQPYAALRDDLIVNMLSIGDFQNAWAHCAKRYRYILPKLYSKAHPIRVVQVWQTAMLALYLASEEGVAPGVDMGLISLMLVSEVRDLCKLSHGENNSFAKSVQKKYEEMITDFRDKLGPHAETKVASQIPNQRKLFMEMGTWAQY